VQNATTFTAQFLISPTATLGARNVTVTSNSQNLTLNNAFNVLDGIPALTSVAPPSGVQGANVALSLGGAFTNWSAASVVTFTPPTGITVGNVTFGSTTALSLSLTLATNAPTGPRSVTVTTGSEVVTLANAFTVNPGQPAFLSLAPTAGKQNETLTATFTTAFTDLQTHPPTLLPVPGITVSNIQVTSPTSFTAQLAIQLSATTGPRTFTVVTNGQNLALSNAFTVNPGPIFNSITPNNGQQSATVPITISGTNTNFTNSSAITFNPPGGITVSSVAATNATTLTASLQIAANAALGLRSVTITTGSEIVTLADSFEIFPPSGTVSGTVFTTNGTTPSPGAILRLFRGTPEVKFAEVTANGTGQYSIPNVPGGPYQVFASNVGNTQFARAAGSIVIQGVVTNNLSLSGSGTVRTTVRDTNEALVPSAPVTVEILGDNIPDEVRALYRRTATANASAVATFSNFPAGSVLGTATNVAATRGGVGSGSMNAGGTATFTIYLAPGAAASPVLSVMRGTIAADDLPNGRRAGASNIISILRGAPEDTLPAGQRSAASNIISLLRGSIVDILPTGFNAAASPILSLARGTPPLAPTSLLEKERLLSQADAATDARQAPLKLTAATPQVLYSGQSVRFTAEGAGTANFLINGWPFGHDLDDPAALSFLVPEGVQELRLRVAPDQTASERMVSEEVRFAVAPAKPATLSGRVTTPEGSPAEGMDVSARYAGLTVELFRLDRPTVDLPDLTGVKPSVVRSIAALNVRNPGRALGASSLAQDLAPDYAARFRAHLSVERPGPYRFRLITSSNALLLMNGAEVARGGETEFLVHLQAGATPLELVTVSGGEGEELRLFWQPPGQEAWRLVPPEAFSAMDALRARTSAEGRFQIEGVPGSASTVNLSAQSSDLEGGMDRLGLSPGAETRVEIPTRRRVHADSSNNGKTEEK
jgi:hypothetical protein